MECHCTELWEDRGIWYIMYYEDGVWNSMMLEDYKRVYGPKGVRA